MSTQHNTHSTASAPAPGYVRLLLILIGWVFFDELYVFLPLYAVSAFLDGEWHGTPHSTLCEAQPQLSHCYTRNGHVYHLLEWWHCV